MNGVILCEASTEAAETIAELIRIAFEEYRGVLDPPSGAHSETAERIRHDMALAHAVLAKIGEAAVGCVFYKRYDDYIYFGRLSVLPDYRRHGIGRALIRHVEQRALELGYRRVRLGVRTPLVQLRERYERMGYSIVDDRTHEGYPNPTVLILEKELAGEYS